MKVRSMIAAAVLSAAGPGAALAAAPPDFDAAGKEAVGLLQAYLRVDTTNPPGNERRAADFFKEIFDREGIESRIYDLGNGRANILARLPGNGTLPPAPAAQPPRRRARGGGALDRAAVLRGDPGRLRLGARRHRHEGHGDLPARDDAAAQALGRAARPRRALPRDGRRRGGQGGRRRARWSTTTGPTCATPSTA